MNDKKLLAELELAETYLLDGAPFSALRIIQTLLGRDLKINCYRCNKPISQKQIRGIDTKGYICCKCVAKEILG